jgi:tetratricopeptide (TPR) repeat protein
MKRPALTQAAITISLALSIPVSVLAQSTDPQADSMYELGMTASKQGSQDSAILFLKRATVIEPNHTAAQYNLGLIYQTRNRYREAIQCFQEVLRMKPLNSDAHYQLGLAYRSLGQLDDARRHLSDVLPSNIHFTEAQTCIAKVNDQLFGPPVSENNVARK